jgi:hypothetical protein
MASKAQQEGRLLLGLQAYQKGQISSIRQAALAYNVPYSTLNYRLSGRVARVEIRANSHKLTPIEEQVLIQWIISMDNRGYPPRVCAVQNAARLLLQQRVGPSTSIGINWTARFIKRQPALQSRFNRKYDYQRAQCEDPELIGAWFRLVSNTIQKYGIQQEDIYNFDETGFAMGIASTSRVVTTSDRRGKPPQLQPGDREWVTAIEAINARGWYLPPMVIFKGKVHLSTWFETTQLPPNWVIALSDNGWTSDELGLKWLSEIFEPNTASKSIGKYRLLILDGHGSHATPEFDQYCSDRSIITLCMPPHSSHLLQPLDVGCFSPLKRAYGTQISEFIRLGVHHVDKAEFLPAFMQARIEAFSIRNIQSGFAAAGLVPSDPDQVLSKLQIRPYTPPKAPIQQTQWQPETPHNVAQLEQQVKVIKDYLQRRSKSPPSPTDAAINQLVKGCQIAMHGAVLLADENEKLRAANERQKRKRAVKKKQISKKTTLTVAEAQGLMQNTVQQPIQAIVAPIQQTVVVTASLSSSTSQGNRFGLPSCFICKGFDHAASDCLKYK